MDEILELLFERRSGLPPAFLLVILAVVAYLLPHVRLLRRIAGAVFLGSALVAGSLAFVAAGGGEEYDPVSVALVALLLLGVTAILRPTDAVPVPPATPAQPAGQPAPYAQPPAQPYQPQSGQPQPYPPQYQQPPGPHPGQ